MGARELLADLADAGLSVTADGDRLLIRPASKLTYPLRVALRDAKPELLALLRAARAGARCGGMDRRQHRRVHRPTRPAAAVGMGGSRCRADGRAHGAT